MTKHLNRKKECINFNFNSKYLLNILNNDLYINLYEYMKDKKFVNFVIKYYLNIQLIDI